MAAPVQRVLTRSGTISVDEGSGSWKWARSRSNPDFLAAMGKEVKSSIAAGTLDNLVYQLELQDEYQEGQESEEREAGKTGTWMESDVWKDGGEEVGGIGSSGGLHIYEEMPQPMKQGPPGQGMQAAQEPMPQSVRSHTEQPARAPPKKGATAEVYGFVFWIASFFLFGLFLMWVVLPESLLHEAGITYYPSKWWNLAGPSYAVACLVMMWCVYVSINLLNTDPLNSLNLYTAVTRMLTCPADDDPLVMQKEVMASGKKDLDAIEKISDIPLSVVNELLYQTRPNRQRRTYRKR